MARASVVAAQTAQLLREVLARLLEIEKKIEKLQAKADAKKKAE